MNRDILLKAGMTEEIARIDLGLCPTCGKEIKGDEFRNDLSKREFEISRMCQACQDEVFGYD